MLPIWRNRKVGDRRQDEFLARYDRIVQWARQLSANRPWQAEDLAQDAYLQFMAIRPDLDQIQNLDAYLYAVVRNLHRSLLHRHLRLRQVPLSILDFDRAEDGLKLTEKEQLQEVCTDLELVREFACERRETSKSGSLLILRFFHGFSVGETARLMGINRVALDTQLLRARKEARDYLANRKARLSGKVVPLASAPAKPEEMRQSPIEFGVADAIDAFRDRIFAADKGECISRSRIKDLYASAGSDSIENRLLAHIVCCRPCLSIAAASAGVAGRDDGPPDDRSGLGAVRRAANRSAKIRRLREWEREYKRLLEHQPQELRVTVNGQPLVSQPVVSGRSELTMSIPLAERIDFIEVLSEQEVRLLMLPVFAAPPEGEFEQAGELDFGDGRKLSVRLTFDDPWPTVHVQYLETEAVPAVANAPEYSSAERPLFGEYAVSRQEIAKAEGFRRLFEWLWGPSSWPNARFWSGATAVVMIFVLLFVQTRETTASAAVLVARMEDWQRSSAAAGSVLHRTFEFIERDKRTARASRRRVEVWRRETGSRPDAQAKISKLFDESGQLLASARINSSLPVFTASNAWQFEPAPDTFRILAGDLGHVRVKGPTARNDRQFELIASSVTLRLDSKSYAPREEAIETPDATFEFRLRSSQAEPETLSPFTASARPLARVSPKLPERPDITPPPPASLVSDAELDASETSARLVLHRLNADLGEQIHVRRREQEIEVAGILDSAERKNAIENALRDVPHLRTSLLSPEDLSASTAGGAIAALQTAPASNREMSPAMLASWLEQHYPDEAQRRDYVNRIRDLGRECLGQAYALKELVDRYGALKSSPVSSIAQDHMAALQKRWAELNDLVAAAIGADPGMQPPNLTLDARENATQLLENVNTLNRTLLRLFTEHSNRQDSNGSVAEIQNYWRLRHDAATSLAALSTQ